MNYKMFSIYDRKAALYGVPFYQVNQATAIRYVKQIGQKTPDFLEDVELYEVGTFDPLRGVVEAYDKPIFVVNGVDCNG